MGHQATEKDHGTGGCYCGALRYALSGPALIMGQCHCRACQHVAGGAPQYFQLVAPETFSWTSGTPQSFERPDLPNAVTRFFCATCGTHVLTQRQDQAELVLKVGTLDAPGDFHPRVALCHAQAQPFHLVADGVTVFDDIPQRG